jgi:hypothetical protein
MKENMDFFYTVLRKVAEETASKCGGQLTEGELPAWGLDEGLTTSHRKKSHYVKIITQGLEFVLDLVNMVLNLRVHKGRGIFWLAERLLASQGFLLHGFS